MLEKCISNLKRNKATCFDNISRKHLLHAGPHINVHLSLLFNSMIHHCFVPSEFCMGIIHPLLKNKHGDATDIYMYRGITISPVTSKVFESVLLFLYDNFLTSDTLQYGFKNIVVILMHCLLLMKLWNTSQKEDQKSTVPFLMPQRHLIKFCTMVYSRNC